MNASAARSERVLMPPTCSGGGRHRSVAIAEHLARQFREREEFFVEVAHRDVDRLPIRR